MIFYFFLVFYTLLNFVSTELIISLPNGNIRGQIRLSHNKHPYWQFQGIPYAEPPLGDLRWLPPLPHQGWNGTLDGGVSPLMCIQGFPDPETTHDSMEIGQSYMLGQEDCLTLNVYTPDTTPDQDLFPILVWFHGGGLSTGQGDMYGPQFLIEYGIIIVTVNYRLGPLGQLSLDTEKVSGNQGLRDQVLALQWIQENIGYFGGDRDKVTISGESAGSWSVTHHMISPLSRGLFRAVIGQSGTTISGLADRFMTREEAAKNGRLYAKEIGCYDDSSAWDGDVVLDCLKLKTARQLFDAQVTGVFSSRPNVDNFSEFQPFLPREPESLFIDGEFQKVPILIGSNSGEGILNAAEYIKKPELLAEEFNDVKYWDEVRGPTYIFDRETRLNGSDITECDIIISTFARQFYFGDTIDQDDLKQFINLNSDVQFWYGTDKLIKLLSPHVSVFHYILFFQDLLSFTINPNVLGTDLGVGHADDLAYLWDIYGLNSGTNLYDFWWSQADKKNSRRMLEMWSNFVKYLNPTPADNVSQDLAGVVWKSVTQDSHEYLRIDEELYMEMTQEYQDRINFWRNATQYC